MRKRYKKLIKPISEAIALVFLLGASAYMLFCVEDPPPLVEHPNLHKEVATVVEVDDSEIMQFNFVGYGTQHLKVCFESNTNQYAACNELSGQMELDKKFNVGDKALVIVPDELTEDSVLVASDHWRLGWILTLFGAFSLFLCIFGGLTGLRALFTFFFSCLAIWKILVPAVLEGKSPVLVSFTTVAILTAVIIFLIAGFSRTGLSAFGGAMLGVLSSLLMAGFFTDVMKIDGSTMEGVQQLLYAGAKIESMRDIFIGAIILASSGAIMDLAMDIATGIAEVKRHNSELGFKELLFSGFRIGRAVLGTMTTTLLLAYSGGYLTLLMLFACEGVKPTDFMNTTLVSAEIVKTLVGSFGLLLVAPFTALVGAFVFSFKSPSSEHSLCKDCEFNTP